MCSSICHTSFHITKNYFQEVQEEVIRVGQYENTASMWFSFMDGSSHHGLKQPLILIVFKWSFLFDMETEQPCLLWFMLNSSAECQWGVRREGVELRRWRRLHLFSSSLPTSITETCWCGGWGRVRIPNFSCVLCGEVMWLKRLTDHICNIHILQCQNSCTSLLSIKNKRTWHGLTQANTKTPSLFAKPRK